MKRSSLPQSILDLAQVEEYEAHGRHQTRVIKARETRVTGLMCHFLIGITILAKDLIALVRKGAT